MPVIKTSRTEILEKATLTFRMRGYHNTSMQNLAEACGLLKGSFYYYFKSKDEILLEVLAHNRKILQTRVFAVAEERDLIPEKRLEKFLIRLGNSLLQLEGGCILGNLAAEIGGLNPEVDQEIKVIFDEWITAMTSVYNAKIDQIKARRAALQTIMEFEGAVMLNKLYRDDQLLKDCFVRAMVRLG
jgi:AcrR family transcriptional regulator